MARIVLAVSALCVTLAGACGQHTGPTPAKVDPAKAPKETKDAKDGKSTPGDSRRERGGVPANQRDDGEPVDEAPVDEPPEQPLEEPG